MRVSAVGSANAEPGAAGRRGPPVKRKPTTALSATVVRHVAETSMRMRWRVRDTRQRDASRNQAELPTDHDCYSAWGPEPIGWLALIPRVWGQSWALIHN